jgi:tetratricopeptide (TPR) repeat protein
MKLKFTLILLFISFVSIGQVDFYLQIKSLYKEGKLQETIDNSTQELSKLSTSDTTYIKLLELRAICFMDGSNFVSAISDYQQLFKLNPRNCDYYSTIYYAYCEIGQDSVGYIFLQKGNAINPVDILILNNMSYHLGQIKRFEESIKYASIGLVQKNVPNNLQSLLLNNRGYAFIYLGKFEKGLKDINKSIDFKPDNSFSYCYRAMANIGLKQMVTVCDDLEKSKNLGAVNLTKELRNEYCSK